MSDFLDYVEIQILSGNGGNGLASFRREKFIPFGGPDGGNGGNGGDIVFIGSNNLNSLRDFRNKRVFKAQNGTNGGSNKRNGKNGSNKVIKVPLGTEILELNTNKKIADIVTEDLEVVLLEGGKGGLGNTFFKSSTNRAPTKYKDGKKGKKLRLALNLKTISDVSLIGYPNVGKSSIIREITNSKASVGNYQFTTITPNIGVLETKNKDFLIADIPGLIKGSHSGKGLGHQFLKHIERSNCLIEVLDTSCLNIEELQEQHDTLLFELKEYNIKIISRIKLIVLNKVDVCKFRDDLSKFKPLKNCSTILASSLDGFGMEDLKREIESI
ncbi:MAG: Obg family GTPase CgtA [Thermodesulfobacteriota bacterium]